jgi:hypothetical protein
LVEDLSVRQLFVVGEISTGSKKTTKERLEWPIFERRLLAPILNPQLKQAFCNKIFLCIGDQCFDHNFLQFSAKNSAFFLKPNVNLNSFENLTVF